MRCLVLAETMEAKGWKVIFLTRQLPGNIDQTILAKGFDVITLGAPDAISEIEEVIRLIRQNGADGVIFDHYDIGAAYERSVKEETGIVVMVLDDTFEAHHCDILLNQNIYAKAVDYAGRLPDVCHCFCGLEYALVRKEFRNAARTFPKEAPIRNILISLGGADPANMTLEAMRAVAEIGEENITARVVVGAANRNLEAIKMFAEANRPLFEIIVNAGNMAALMQQADAAITAGGGTTIETLYMGLPSLVIGIAPNQDLIVRTLKERKLALTVGREERRLPEKVRDGVKRLLEDGDFRRQFRHALESLHIGAGIKRVSEYLDSRADPDLTLVEATPADSEKLLELANDQTVRDNSFNSNTIRRDEHEKWLEGVLKDPARLLLIVKNEGRFGGQVRFDGLEGEAAEISISLSQSLRGRSLAVPVIRKAIARLHPRKNVKRVLARIKRENEASRRSFEKAGFVLSAATPETSYITMEYTL